MFRAGLMFGCAVALYVFCGCDNSARPQCDVMPSVRRIVDQLHENGGRQLNTIHICDEIKSDIAGITNSEMRVRCLCAASDAIVSVDFSSLSYQDRVEAANKYWHLFAQFYGLLSEQAISDGQRTSFLVNCMKKYKDVSFSVPTFARQQDESDCDFSARRAAIRALYAEYSNNVRLWRRFFRNGALRTMKSIDGSSLDDATAFFLEYPSETEFFQKPVFTGGINNQCHTSH